MWHGYDSMPWMWRAPRDLKAHAEGSKQQKHYSVYRKLAGSHCTTPNRTLNCSAALLLVAGCSGL
jgi:hypothetical protein